MYGLKTEASFDGAHFLTDYHGKCENLHGHRWRVVAYVRQEELQAEGTTRDMVVDFGAFKQAVREEVARLDHMFLVEEGSLRRSTIEALQGEGFTLLVLPFRTTAENLARYLYQRISARHLPVSQVDVYETPLNCASYFGE
ncbi:6-pyruvoyl trahydropterin synthase family protein [Olsenella uli]|uniref:6-pyruvoyl trahydropterin synthase family protein n=1 Tax=Olsenella uli TaxID=133926 RepID=UPI0028EE39FF|nr:6-carboxytetrahydropterin synthase [Olsenella uli]